MPDIPHLANFLTVVRYGSFRRAAEAVHLSQSALSRSVQSLERELDRQLLVRGRSGITVTEHGRIVIDHAERILNDRQRLLAALERTEADSAPVRIGLGTFPAELSGIEAAARVAEREGRLWCRLQVADYRRITDELRAGRLDLGFCDLAAAREDPAIQLSPLGACQLYAYTRAGHPLQDGREVDIEAIFRYPLIGPRTPLRLLSTGTFPSVEIDDRTGEVLPALDVVSPSQVVKLLHVSDAVAFATLAMVKPLLDRREVELVHERIPELNLDQGFIALAEKRPVDLANSFVEEVKKVEAERAERERELEIEYGIA